MSTNACFLVSKIPDNGQKSKNPIIPWSYRVVSGTIGGTFFRYKMLVIILPTKIHEQSFQIYDCVCVHRMTNYNQTSSRQLIPHPSVLSLLPFFIYTPTIPDNSTVSIGASDDRPFVQIKVASYPKTILYKSTHEVRNINIVFITYKSVETRDSSVGIATGWTTEVCFPAETKKFSLLHSIQEQG
jgi:hypothetical protein